MYGHMLPQFLRIFESSNNPYSPLHYLNTMFDMGFYDMSNLSLAEFTQAVWRPQPEGSIIIIEPGKAQEGYVVCACADSRFKGIEKARASVDFFEQTAAKMAAEGRPIDTLVVAGCGSSTAGAVAFGKQVADILQKPVASIVCGHGVQNVFGEIFGGMTLGLVSQAVHAVIPLIRANLNQPGFRRWAKDETNAFINAMPEVQTLRELITRNLFVGSGAEASDTLQLKPRSGPDACSIRTVVSHSKGNWVVWGALLGIEFMLDETTQINLPKSDLLPHIDVVTFGCWVEMPEELRRKVPVFHYHQFVGTLDVLLGLTQSPYQKTLEMAVKGIIEGFEPDHRANPDESLVPFRGHELQRVSPSHMPIERILKECVEDHRLAA